MGQLLQPGHRGPRLYLRLHGIGTYRIHFYFMDNDRYDPQNDKGIYYLRTTRR